MLRSSLCLLLSAAFVSVFFAAPLQGYDDVQSLQYEFGRGEAVSTTPCSSCSPVVYAPVPRACCAPVYPTCYSPCYRPYCPVPKVYRHACVRPGYCSPYYRW
ncbi:MAG: hypothetical protein LBI05_05420 [Planctomycetaceae bacterium]|jgi:hypothetical protein|nr:hypothetical protein [Planctomycetaceae bacterium]